MTGNTCKYKQLLWCVLCSLLLSCVQEENESSIVKSGRVTKVFNAMLVEEDTSETKVSFDGSYMSASRPVLWTPEDEVAVFEHGTFSVTKFINISKTSAASCVLEGITYDAENYSALYPFGVVKSVDEDNVYLTLPPVQHYYEDDIDPSAFPMTAKLNGNTFNFKNICGVLVLQLQGEGTVESITFKGYDSNSKLMKVAGDAYVNHSYSSVPSLHMGEESAISVELSCGAEGVKLSESESTPFHIILPPATYSSFELNIVLADGRSMKKSADKPLVIQRSMRTTASAFKFEDVISVSGVTLDKTSLELTVGDEATLIADVTPDNATNKNISWSSSNTAFASVDNGKVTALKAGTTIITVKTEDGNKTATCEVTVNAKVYPVTGVTLDKTSATLTEGDELILTATVNPDNATNKNVTWSSSDNTVASVSNGKVTALKAGKATITVKTDDGGKTATCEVTVNAKVYPIDEIILDKTYIEIKVGSEITLTATIYPSNATNKTLKWTSSDTNVATVSNGKITALKAGQVVVKAISEEYNISAICEVKVLADGPSGSNENIGENEGIWK